MQEIPKTMHAAAIDRFGGPQVLSIHSMPVPAHQAREVLIRLDTAGVAGWDADMRDGWSPGGRRRFPLVPGTEGGGTVVAVGSRVLATASGKDGLALVRRLGADMVVDGKRGDILAAARRFAPSGVDAVLAFVGGKALTRCIDALRRGGRVAYPHGVEPAPRKRRGIKLIPY